jgi:hypothetical protein
VTFFALLLTASNLLGWRMIEKSRYFVFIIINTRISRKNFLALYIRRFVFKITRKKGEDLNDTKQQHQTFHIWTKTMTHKIGSIWTYVDCIHTRSGMIFVRFHLCKGL